MRTDSTAQNFMRNAFGDAVLYEVNRNAFDREGAPAVFDRHFGKSLFARDHLYIIIGTDSGLLAHWILRNELPEGTRYLFIEPESLLDVIDECLPQIADNPRVALTSPENWAELHESFQFQDYAYLEAIKVIQSIGAADAFLTDYREMYWSVQSQVRELTWSIQFQLGSQAFVLRQIENIADNRVPAICLQDAFHGSTAVLLGGGPSLDDLIPWVQTHRNQIVLIAVSRICRRLLQADLQPDIVVSIDPHDLSFDVSKEMLRFSPDTLLIHSYHVSPLLLAQWHGPAVYFADRLPWKSEHNPKNLLNQGPTVTNTALAMAVNLGFSQVVLGGVDLCYSKEGHTHASGSNERNAGPMLGNDGVQVETNSGGMADTRHSFASAVAIMGTQAAAALEKDCTIINPAPTAAKIPNVEHRSTDAIALIQQSPANQIIEKCLPPNTAETRKKHYASMLKAIAKAKGRLREISKLAEQALECNDGLFGRNGKSADFKYKKRMDKIEKKLDREYKDISPLVKNFGSRTFLRLVRPDKERDWSDTDIEQWGRAYYLIYKDASESLQNILEQARERLLSRQMEEAPAPDFKVLHAQWQKDRTPGRARVWRDWHPEHWEQLDDQQRQPLVQSIDVFESIMQQTDTEQAQWCKDNYTLDPVRAKLATLFTQQDREELAKTIQILRQLDSPEASKLQALAEGYLAELNDQPDEAMGAYQQLVDLAAAEMHDSDQALPHSAELEDALKRMSGIAIGQRDDQQALMLLQILTSLSQSYAPQYAELLKLTGDLQGAVDVYANYLENAPNDLGAMLKLGRIFEIAGADDSAAWAYGYILEKDPDHQAAKNLLANLGRLKGSTRA